MITSTDNQTVKDARALLEPKGRREQGRFLVEGVRLVEEAMRAGVNPVFVFCLPGARERERAAALLAAAESAAARVLELAPRVFETLTDTVSSQGIIAVASIPRVTSPPHPSFNLVLDQLRDPGNMGTILRAAEAAGAERVVLTPGCVDPWSPKVVRSAMGAHFRLPAVPSGWAEINAVCHGREPAPPATPWGQMHPSFLVRAARPAPRLPRQYAAVCPGCPGRAGCRRR